jgi:ribosomal protein S18 acetylase RimI-like enzyme
MASFTIRATTPADRPRVIAVLTDAFAGPAQAVRGRLYPADELPAFIAEREGEPVGLISYLIEANACEIMALVSLEEDRGIGTALLEAAADAARAAGCGKLRIVTTNDNTRALRFYQKRGLRLVALYVNAEEEARKLKPEIPLTGNDGIPLRDELELEMEL